MLECDVEVPNILMFDIAGSYTDPKLIQKGSEISFHIQGGFFSPVELTRLKVVTYLKNLPVYFENHDINKEFQFGDLFVYEQDWKVPPIAPNTLYDNIFHYYGMVDGEEKIVGCFEGQFTFA